jgi:N-acetylmuramoyl-L-alanine amidase
MSSAKSLGPLPPGLFAPVTARKGEYFQILTPFERTGWVHFSRVKTHDKAGAKPGSLKGATIVIDPGHGGHLGGARGPGGYREKDANLAISRRLVEKLTGARVFLTRGEGHAGLAYRAGLANRLGAHAFVSVHNNALPDKLSTDPGSEVYHQRRSADSKRLAGLIYEELYRSFSRFKIKWGRDPFAGAKYRISHQHGGEYYAVLRRAVVPAVISEGMFITNGPEEQLLRRADVRELYATALARGVTRYFTTNDPGSGFKDPYAKPTPNCPIPGCFEHRK